MKKISKIVLPSVVVVLLLLVGCSERQMISDSKMEAILTESFLRRSLINVENSSKNNRAELEDSLDYHSDILAKYGYTFDDFNYTVSSMAKRKSNPLEPILNNVLKEIDKQAIVAEYRYENTVRFDTTAMSYFRDTLVWKESLHRGSFQGLDSIIFADTLFQNGIYTISVNYQTMADYKYPTKSLRYYFADTTDTKPDTKTIWLSRSAKSRQVSNEYTLKDGPKDSLVIYFQEDVPTYVKNGEEKTLAKDTSQIIYLRVLYTPLLETARERYFRSFFGEDFAAYREYEKPKEPFVVRVDAPYRQDTVFVKLSPKVLERMRLDSIRLDSLRTLSRSFFPLKPDSLMLNSLGIVGAGADTLYYKRGDR
ncbi:MAG: DUF4296 domain-containing protein [Rikenellaceae bacterium]